jgi:preprotein translocase subunit YajC
MGGIDPFYIIMYGALLFVLWFFMIRPQSKKAKEQAEFSNSIQKGEKVVTTGGIHGKIVRADDNETSLLLEVDNNVKIRIEKSAVSMELTKAAYPSDKKVEAEAKS